MGKSFEFRAALYDKFYQYPDYFTIISECTKTLMREIDVVVIPCTNSWGFPHESFVSLLRYGALRFSSAFSSSLFYDFCVNPFRLLAPFYKKPVEQLVKQWIYETYLGEQPYGTSFLLEGKRKFICWTCLSRTPDNICNDFVYSFIWSAFSEINIFNHYKRLEESSERFVSAE